MLGPGNTALKAHILVWEHKRVIKVYIGYNFISDVRIKFQLFVLA